MLDNTIVIFSSDHGEMAGDHNLRGKGNFYEASCHVPMLVRWPGTAPAGAVRDDLVALTDVTATMWPVRAAQCHPIWIHSLYLAWDWPANRQTTCWWDSAGARGWPSTGATSCASTPSGFQALFDLENDRRSNTTSANRPNTPTTIDA